MISLPEEIIKLSLASSGFMAGLVWYVQLVHYPSFHFLTDRMYAFHKQHVKRTGWIVMPVMLIELGTSALLLYLLPVDWLNVTQFGMVVILWISTFLIQVPLHNKIGAADSIEEIEETINTLIQTNWLRTLLWSGRAALLLIFWV